MTTKPKNTNIPSKPLDTYSPTKEFFNFLFYKRIGRALGWIVAKIDAYLSDEVPAEGRSSRIAAQNGSDDLSLSQVGAWGSAFVYGLKMLIIPLKKIYQYYKWRQDPATRKKPTFTATDAFYLTVDMALFGMTVAAAALASSFASVVVGVIAAVVAVVSGIVEFAHLWKNREKHSDPKTTSHPYWPVAKRTLSVVVPSLGLVGAGLVLLGTVLGPIGLPLVFAGIGIGVGVAVLGTALWIGQKVDNYVVQKSHQRKIESCLLKGSFEDEPDLTLSEKISRMFEIQRFLSKNTEYNEKRYFKFFKNSALVMALKNQDYRENFSERLQQKQEEVSRELLKARPLSEKKEIPLDIIVEHVIANPSYAKTFLQKRYGTTVFRRRNFRKELSERPDLVLKLKTAATENTELAEAIRESTVENSRHFKKQAKIAGKYSHEGDASRVQLN